VLTPGSGTSTLSGGTTQASSSGAEQTDSSEAGANASTTTTVDNQAIVAVSGAGGSVVGRAVEDAVLGQSFYHIPSEDQRPRMVSQNLLQDVVVLQVGNFPYAGQPLTTPEEAAPQTAAGPAQPAEEQAATVAPQPPDVITLIVTPQDAISLNYLMFSGSQLTLVLRAAGDDTRVETESVTLQFLLQQYDISVPAKLPTGLEPATRVLRPPVLQNDAAATPAP
jgi:pilus assembly protein CpaB